MSACARCGKPFTCAMADGAQDQPCWCTQMPILPRSAVEADQARGIVSCLCKDCLAARIAEAEAGNAPQN